MRRSGAVWRLGTRPLQLVGSDLCFDLGSLAGDLRAFDRQLDLSLKQLLFPVGLQLLESVAFLANDFVVVDGLTLRGRL